MRTHEAGGEECVSGGVESVVPERSRRRGGREAGQVKTARCLGFSASCFIITVTNVSCSAEQSKILKN